MRIYYQTASVLITEQEFRVKGRPPWRIDDFDDMYVVDVRETEPPQWRLRRIWPATVVILAGSVVAVHDLVGGGGAPLFVPAVVLVVCAGVLIGGGRNTGSISELWAVTEAGHVCLFRSRDKRTFDQIRRAVVRARESGRA